MEKFYQTESDPKQLSPLTLAYVGDGVYELFVREYIVSKGNCPVKKLHSRAVFLPREKAAQPRRFVRALRVSGEGA